MPKKPNGPNVGVRAEDGSIVPPKFYKKMGTTRKTLPKKILKKAQYPTGMMGTNADQRGAKKLKGFDYSGSKNGGIWKNPNGVQVGRSAQEDSTIYPQKSTGDTATPASLQNAIHIHLHGSKTDGGANYQKLAKTANKLRGRKK
jgi:hypothetical protein